MAFVSTMILRSMRLTGEKTRGATLTTAEQTETLDEFNTFLESLSIERLLTYTVTQDSHLLSVSTATYSIGPGATINTARPTKLVDPCFVRDSSGYDYPLTIIPIETYGRLTDKSTGATIPTHIYYDRAFSATSTASLTLYPPPSAGLTLFMNSWTQFSTVSTQSVNLSLPEGYRLFLESNFAIHLAAGALPITKEVAKIAQESKANIRKLNLPDMIARVDKGALSGVVIDHGIYIDSEYIE